MNGTNRRTYQTFKNNGINFQDSAIIFEEPIIIKPDDRFDYGEDRWIGIGKLQNMCIVLIFTKRESKIRIISIRKANKEEKMVYHEKTK